MSLVILHPADALALRWNREAAALAHSKTGWIKDTFLHELVRTLPDVSLSTQEIGLLSNSSLPMHTHAIVLYGRNKTLFSNKKLLVMNSSQGHLSPQGSWNWIRQQQGFKERTVLTRWIVLLEPQVWLFLQSSHLICPVNYRAIHKNHFVSTNQPLFPLTKGYIHTSYSPFRLTQYFTFNEHLLPRMSLLHPHSTEALKKALAVTGGFLHAWEMSRVPVCNILQVCSSSAAPFNWAMCYPHRGYL